MSRIDGATLVTFWVLKSVKEKYSMVKTFLKLLLCIIVYTVVFTIVNLIMPFSQGFRELGSSENPAVLLFFTFINVAWICFTIFFIIKHSHFSGIKLYLNIVYVIFFIQTFLTQMETFLFSFAFPALTKIDIVLLVLTDLVTLLAVVPLMVKLFQNKDITADVEKINIKTIAIKLGIISVIYLCIYQIFGFFVAWQFEEVQTFYSELQDNSVTSVIFPYQILRGLLFGFFIIPLKKMISKKIPFVVSVCLVYLCTAVMLIVPNPLFPDEVRIAHLIEMSTSMLLFGIIAANILWGRERRELITKS